MTDHSHFRIFPNMPNILGVIWPCAYLEHQNVCYRVAIRLIFAYYDEH